MALIKTETFKNENGFKMIREFFGRDAEHISGIVEKPVPQENEPIETEELISQDEINAEILLNQTQIMAKQAEQDEVLAEILLGQVGGAENV